MPVSICLPELQRQILGAVKSHYVNNKHSHTTARTAISSKTEFDLKKNTKCWIVMPRFLPEISTSSTSRSLPWRLGLRSLHSHLLRWWLLCAWLWKTALGIQTDLNNKQRGWGVRNIFNAIFCSPLLKSINGHQFKLQRNKILAHLFQ